MTSAGFEAAVPAIERPHTYALDRMATGIDGVLTSFIEMYGIIWKYATAFFKNAYSTVRWARNRYSCDGVTKDNGTAGHY